MPTCGQLGTGASYDCTQKDTGGLEQVEIVLANGRKSFSRSAFQV